MRSCSERKTIYLVIHILQFVKNFSALEDAKTAMDVERTRLQTQVRDMERDMLQLQQQLRFTQEELQKCQENNAQAQNEEKGLLARLTNESEERERMQLQLQQMKKQVRKYKIFVSCTLINANMSVAGYRFRQQFRSHATRTRKNACACGRRGREVAHPRTRIIGAP